MDPSYLNPELTISELAITERTALDIITEETTATAPSTTSKNATTTASPVAEVAEDTTEETTAREASVPETTVKTTTLQAPSTTPQETKTTSAFPLFNLTGKVIIVTGGARGLGLSLAETLVEHGAIVHALDRLPTPSSDFHRISVSFPPGALTFHTIDVLNVPHLNSLITSIATSHSGLHGLIAAAGIQHEASALSYPAETCSAILAVNITGVLSTAQAVAHEMLRHHTPGSIALIASMSGTIANRGLPCAAYNASKAGVQQLARSLAAEWGALGIRVNSISPGYIVTQMVEELFEKFPERREQWASENMLGRLATPEDFGGAAVFLMGAGSAWMTGADLRIDGGHAAW